jgi:hypothetical protein
MRSCRELVAADDPQAGPVLFCLQDRRVPLAGQILDGVGVQERLVELAPLKVAHIAERRVADSLPDSAAQRGARNEPSLDRHAREPKPSFASGGASEVRARFRSR